MHASAWAHVQMEHARMALRADGAVTIAAYSWGGGWSLLSLAAMVGGCVIVIAGVVLVSSMLGMVIRGCASCIAAVDGAGVVIIHHTEDKNAISGICTTGSAHLSWPTGRYSHSP